MSKEMQFSLVRNGPDLKDKINLERSRYQKTYCRTAKHHEQKQKKCVWEIDPQLLWKQLPFG